MSDLNSQFNRVVWCDVPVADLDRACEFYGSVLAIKLHRETFGDVSFAVLEHQDGNGGCLVPRAAGVSPASQGGLLVYFHVNGRLAQAVQEAEKHGGRILEPPRSIGPHGSRAVLLDSEGNRIALHSREQTESSG